MRSRPVEGRGRSGSAGSGRSASAARPGVRFGLARKITLLVGAILLVVAAATIWLVARYTASVLRTEFQAKGKAITHSLAAAGQAILGSDPITVESMIHDLRKIHGVAYVLVVDPSQTGARIHTFKPDVPKGLLEAARLPNPWIETVRDLRLPGVGRVMDITAPIMADEPGVIHVGMAYDLIDAAVRALVLQMLAVFGAGLVVAIGLAALLARLLVRPVTALVATAEAVGRGDLRARPAITTRDELAVLAGSVGAMADQLGAMIGRIAGSADALGNASGEIRDSLGVVVQGSEGQVRLTEQTAAAMTQVDSSVRAVKGHVERLLGSARTSAQAVSALSARTDEVAGAAQQLHATAEETSTSAGQIAAAIATLDDSASAFGAIVEETSTAVAAMDLSVGAVAERARETADAAARNAADAGRGRGAVSSLASHVEESREVGRQAAVSITELQREMMEISGILRLIDDVADQTNLLALNAAIIAAQAGEHGRGFAVVASEIKGLAERTGVSVKQIGEVIARIQRNAAATVEAVLASSRRMEAGVEAAARAREALDQIQASSTESGARVQAIVTAAEEHARGREVIRASMDRLAAVAAEIGKATGEQRSGGERLREIAEQLKSIAGAVSQATQEQAQQGREISTTMKNVAEMVQEISAAAADEERQARDVVCAVSEIDTIARKNRESVGRLEAVVDRLRERADGLEAEVGRFQR
jgi:methyl-accepting chemotaxis protein